MLPRQVSYVLSAGRVSWGFWDLKEGAGRWAVEIILHNAFPREIAETWTCI